MFTCVPRTGAAAATPAVAPRSRPLCAAGRLSRRYPPSDAGASPAVEVLVCSIRVSPRFADVPAASATQRPQGLGPPRRPPGDVAVLELTVRSTDAGTAARMAPIWARVMVSPLRNCRDALDPHGARRLGQPAAVMSSPGTHSPPWSLPST